MSSNHIMVISNCGSEPMQIPLDPDNTISLWKLTLLVGREVVNLKYMVGSVSLDYPRLIAKIEWKTLPIFNNRIQPPEDDWDAHPLYYCVTTTAQSPGSRSEEPNQSQPESTQPGDEFEELSVKALCNEYETNGFCLKQFDNQCDLIHGDECDICHRYSLHPFNEVQRENHARECIATTLEETDSKICSICLENVKELFPTEGNLKPFGLLDGCEHVYCIGCIEKWKEEGNETCPECRMVFDIIIPCDHFNVTHDEKLRLIQEHSEYWSNW